MDISVTSHISVDSSGSYILENAYGVFRKKTNSILSEFKSTFCQVKLSRPAESGTGRYPEADTELMPESMMMTINIHQPSHILTIHSTQFNSVPSLLHPPFLNTLKLY